MGGPELELGVAGGAELYEVLVAPVVQFDARDRLRVAAVEPFGREGQDHAIVIRRNRLNQHLPERAVSHVNLVPRLIPSRPPLRVRFHDPANDQSPFELGHVRLELPSLALLIA
jgi:hypothetical protein